MKIIGIIPARSGSKGVPGKNTRKLHGKPLIEYTIQPALKSKLNRIVISTDSIEIGEIGGSLGIEYILRPPELASDSALMLPVIRHVISELENHGEYFDAVMLLQPTCPLRNTADIDSVIHIMNHSQPDTVISVSKVGDYHPMRMYKMENGMLKSYEESMTYVNRQELPPLFHRNGAIYCTKTKTIKNQGIYGNKILPYIMGREKSINIDDLYDWRIAEHLTTNRD
jgi:N-acylneuraminate cytidylyltransferase